MPKGPAAPRQIPGLPGVIQQPSGKRKNASFSSDDDENDNNGTLLPPRTAAAPTNKNKKPQQEIIILDQSPEPIRAVAPPKAVAVAEEQQGRSSKRSRPASHTDTNKHHRSLPPPPPSSSPAVIDFSPLPPPPSDVQRQLEQSRRNFTELQAVYLALQEENTALKNASIRDQVEELFAQHSQRVQEHGEKATELATQWREEAQTLADVVGETRVEVVTAENRQLRADLATARQALLDLEVKKLEKEKAVVELQKRNSFLEKVARKKPPMVNRCIGTDGTDGYAMHAGVQVPSFPAPLPMHQARAMAPEGVVAANPSSQYHHMHRNNGRRQTVGMDVSYSLQGQRSSFGPAAPHLAHRYHHDTAPSDMVLDSSVQQQHQQQQQYNGGANGIHTQESVWAQGRVAVPPPPPQQQQQQRRISAPPAPIHLSARPGQSAVEVSRQIQFYSNSLSAVVEEEGEEEGRGGRHNHDQNHDDVGVQVPSTSMPLQGQDNYHNSNNNNAKNNTTNNNNPSSVYQQQPSASLMSHGQALMKATNMTVRAMRGGAMQFTHPPTGFIFILQDDCSDPEFSYKYTPVNLGSVSEGRLREVAGGADVLLDEGWFAGEQAEMFFGMITMALGRARMEQQQLRNMQGAGAGDEIMQ